LLFLIRVCSSHCCIWAQTKSLDCSVCFHSIYENYFRVFTSPALDWFVTILELYLKSLKLYTVNFVNFQTIC
jgi:hypothetical protein